MNRSTQVRMLSSAGKRCLPDAQALRELMRFKPLDLHIVRARVNSAQTIADLRTLARRRTPTPAFDYVDGGSFGEHSKYRNRETFDQVEFVPSVLRDVSTVDPSGRIAGTRFRIPVGIAPTGLTRLAHSSGEKAGASAADAAGVPFSLSTMGTASIEDIATNDPDATRWFQLYLWKDREKSLALVSRALEAGYTGLIVTVDTPVGGARYRDARNGMTLPPTISFRTLVDASYRPAWWLNFLTTESLGFANFASDHGSVMEQANEMFDASLEVPDLAWLRSNWPGKLIVKGIQTANDALRAFDTGADAIVISNHGGRQLDRAPVPMQVLPSIRAATGPAAEIILDSGIMTGGDVVAALANGANFTLIGRAYLYGLMAGGELGARRALTILESEIRVVMKLLGVTRLADLTPDHVRQYRPGLSPHIVPAAR